MKELMDERMSDIYHKLLETEYEKLKKCNFNFKNPRSFLTISDICNVSPDVNISELVLMGFLIPFHDEVYRTMHFDLIYRLINVRNLEHQPPIPFEFKIVLKKELVPDFGKYDIDLIQELLPAFPHRDFIIKCLRTSLRRTGYSGLSSYQFLMLKELLSGSYKNIAIVAPTASGKTLTFLIPSLVKAIERILNNKVGTSSIFIYPRKALEKDQLQLILRILDIINTELQAQRRPAITIGIDDSDTPRSANDGDLFRKLKCVSCKEGELKIKYAEGRSIVVCQNCGKEYSYIIPTKDEIWKTRPHILITNMWIVYRRLLSRRTINIFRNIDYVIIDEAHVYTHFLGGHVSYILRMLRFVASQNGQEPKFIFSSATIPNPREFIAALAGVNKDELFYLDFQETLEKAPGKKNTRILLYVYLLPRPNMDVETLTEALILAVTLWCHKNNMKAITFIDSIAEINTLMEYIHTTILGIREGREVTDHIFKTVRTFDNDYYWASLTPSQFLNDPNAFRDFVLRRYKQSIGMHYSGLPLEKRAEIENAFRSGEKRMLLSTSTLELGIDLSDVAVIIQHKLPLTPEGVVQRIGRAGRSTGCYRVALGIIVLPTLPLSTLYMFNEELRNTLEHVGSLPPLRIGELSFSIIMQHTLSLLLLKRSLEGRATYIDEDVEEIKNVHGIISCLEQIRNDLNELHGFNKHVNLFKDDLLKNSIDKMIELIDPLLIGLSKLRCHMQSFDTDHTQESDIEADIESNIGEIKEVIKISIDLDEAIPKIDDMQQIKNFLRELVGSMNLILVKLYDIRKVIGNNPSLISQWLHENHNEFISIISRLPTYDDIMRNINALFNIMLQLSKGTPSRFDAMYSVKFSNILNKMSKIADKMGNKERGIVKFLEELPLKLGQLGSIDFEMLNARKALKRVETEIKTARMTQSKIDLFQILNRLFDGKVYFSLLLEAPSPDIELMGVEEV
jgi:hypothetical protein